MGSSGIEIILGVISDYMFIELQVYVVDALIEEWNCSLLIGSKILRCFQL
jgi:hypothetical protein